LHLTRDYNPVLQELSGGAALQGPAGADGRPLRCFFSRFELSSAELGPWAAAVAAGAGGGYEAFTFGVGRVPGDAGTKAAAAAAAPAARGSAGAAEAPAGAVAEGEGLAAGLARRALALADASCGGGRVLDLEALPGVGHSLHAMVWARPRSHKDKQPELGTAGAGGAAAAAGGVPVVSEPARDRAVGGSQQQAATVTAGRPYAGPAAPLRCVWGPYGVTARVVGELEAGSDGSSEPLAAPDAMELV
jgi:hypothetical protein